MVDRIYKFDIIIILASRNPLCPLLPNIRIISDLICAAMPSHRHSALLLPAHLLSLPGFTRKRNCNMLLSTGGICSTHQLGSTNVWRRNKTTSVTGAQNLGENPNATCQPRQVWASIKKLKEAWEGISCKFVTQSGELTYPWNASRHSRNS